MHKKILGLFIVLGSILGITNATFNNVLEYNLPGYAGYRGDSYILNEIDKQINIENKQIVFYTPANSNRYLTFGRVNSKPYIIETYSNSTIYGQGEPYVCISDIDNYKTYCDPYNYNSQGREAGRNAMKQQGILTGFENVNLSIDFDKFIYPLCSEGYNCDTSVFGYEGMIGFASTNNNYVILFPYTITYSANNYFIHTGNLVSSLTNATSNSVRFDIFDTTSPFIGGTQEPETNTGCINIMTQITMYGYKYNTGLCYTNNKEWSGTLYEGERVTVTPKSIFEIFNSYNEYQTRKGIYINSCHAPYTQEYCLSRMQDKPYATEIFSKIENAGLEPMKVYQYCHLQLEFTEEEKRSTDKCTAVESGTYYATGVTSEEANPNPLEGITNVLQEGAEEMVLPADDTVFDEILPDGILSWKDVATNVNFMKTFINLGKKFLIIFRIRTYREGIIPTPISSLILLFVLYHLIRKK